MNKTEYCYCGERDNPKIKEYFENIPKGYCGFCDICGKAGHLKAHPRSPTSGTWCDKHYDELLSYRIWTLNDMIPFVTLTFVIVIFIAVIFSVVKS